MTYILSPNLSTEFQTWHLSLSVGLLPEEVALSPQFNTSKSKLIIFPPDQLLPRILSFRAMIPSFFSLLNIKLWRHSQHLLLSIFCNVFQTCPLLSHCCFWSPGSYGNRHSHCNLYLIQLYTSIRLIFSKYCSTFTSKIKRKINILCNS